MNTPDIASLPAKWRANADRASAESVSKSLIPEAVCELRAEAITFRACAAALEAALASRRVEVTDAMVTRGLAAARAYWDDESLQAACKRCAGRGYHHGFGEDGNDPDWCDDCGGNGTHHEGTEAGEVRAALTAALQPSGEEG